jgi:hypothetical protein
MGAVTNGPCLLGCRPFTAHTHYSEQSDSPQPPEHAAAAAPDSSPQRAPAASQQPPPPQQQPQQPADEQQIHDTLRFLVKRAERLSAENGALRCGARAEMCALCPERVLAAQTAWVVALLRRPWQLAAYHAMAWCLMT